jgi:hypothetical protein
VRGHQPVGLARFPVQEIADFGAVDLTATETVYTNGKAIEFVEFVLQGPSNVWGIVSYI